MRIKRLLSIGLLATLGAIGYAELSQAVPIVAKETRTGDVYVSGLTGYQKLKAEYAGLPKTAKKSANECGFIKITASSTSSPVGSGDSLKLGSGSTVTVASLPVEAAPKCSAGSLSGTNLTPSAVLKTAEGDVYFTGLTPFSTSTITYLSLPTARSITANTCGVARLSNSGNYVVSSGAIAIKDKTTDAAVASITDYATLTGVSGGPVCKNGATFTTADWPTE